MSLASNLTDIYDLKGTLAANLTTRGVTADQDDPLADLVDKVLDIVYGAPVTGMTLWLDATQLTGLVNNDPVTSWTDMSGNNYHAVQATADYKPLYKTNVQNGLPAIYFDGSNDYLRIASSTATFKFMHSGDNTTFIVCKCGSSSDPNALYGLIANNKGSGAYDGFRICFDDRASVPLQNNIVHGVTNGSGSVISNGLDYSAYAATWLVICVRSNPDETAIASQRSTYTVNGRIPIQKNTTTTAKSTANADYNVDVGALGDATYPLLGYIGEIIVYNSLLTQEQISKTLLYLYNKWGIASA
jgi:hypothetical protein